jgi:putative AlgH/UPF0301 family transcriptional regulator
LALTKNSKGFFICKELWLICTLLSHNIFETTYKERWGLWAQRITGLKK